MLYALLQWLENTYEPPGFQVFQFITVRAGLAALTALAIALFAGKRIINWLRYKQLGERVREGEGAGAVNHAHKAGTPTMGGVIILLSLLGSAFLWSSLDNVYVWMAMIATAWMGAFGFADDYIKTVRKNKEGLRPRYKLIGQISIGLILGGVLYFHPQFESVRSLTHMPFVAGSEFDYFFFRDLAGGMDLGWLVYIPAVVFILTGVSNAVNLTDGLDGLTAGVTAFVAVGLAALAYISGNASMASFLEVMFLPGSGELTIFAVSMAAACLGFLWYNGYPAAVFMGDTGSLALGAAVGALAILVRKELLLPLMGLIFFAEALSVILQTSYFKYTRKRYGKGQRIFRMAPIHHHFEAGGTHEAKIVTRFWIITAITTVATILTLRAQ